MLTDLEPLATTTGAYVFVVVLGLLWGSFANVCIYRWPPSAEFPKGRSVVAPGSHCFACKTPIRWYDNVPLVSWLWLRGKCRACKAPFSARYLLVEAVMGALFGVAWWMAVVPGSLSMSFGMQLAQFGVYAAFCFVMVVITFIDVDHKLILDKVTIPSIVLFYALGVLLGRHWSMGLVGIAVGYGLPWVVGEIYFIIAERDGLGLGDSMLLAVVGALLGWRGVLVALFLGAISGSVIGTIALLRAPAGAPTDATGDASTSAPPRSRASSLVAVGAVGATVTATATALAGHMLVAGIACGAAVVLLVVSRRLDPAPADEPAPDTSATADSPPPRVAALLAALSALLFVGAAGAVILAMTPVAIALAAAAGISLFFARRRFAAEIGDETAAELVEQPEEDASLLRTELPFGPFLAMGAVFYLFAETWLVLQLRLVGG